MKYSYRTASPDRYALLKEFAKKNRQHPTLAESLLWAHLRREDGKWRFKRQHVIGDYIADFVSLEKSLVIEVDGAYHEERGQMEDDEQRTKVLQQMGFEVIRFTNEEIITSIEAAMEAIIDKLESC